MSGEIKDKWEKTGLLKGLSEKARTLLAYALQSQYEFNEEKSEESNNMPPSFKLISIPLLRRALPLTEYKVPAEKRSGLLMTDVDWNVDVVVYDLDRKAEWIADAAMDLNYWINQWTKRNGPLNFKSFGIKEGKIVIHLG